ncbi:glycosyltransferase family 52 protein [Acinetobacter ursingii]|uniref:glycosyltransferase family 52 protein n=1 Tax=Acinetobacter ursingii TaxID=108980 RepID=UPI0021CD7F18|nr:glycosyltransferase family 52 protein [Acinetobacter ursingii]MCU4482543.1 glycosyltransferase family 52 protein [Acinetobacter ursingii]MCU4506817.1 glycosyltransferase family 52 protein [Acinetobacter ursingii]
MLTNLIICLTPLQMLIAEKIIEKEGGNFELLCFYYNDNEKYDYYYNRLCKVCVKKNRYLVNSTNKIERFKEILKFIFFIKKNMRKKYINVYLSSIDNSFFHVLLSKIFFTNLFTFDDGSANINNRSSYFLGTNISRVQKVFLAIIGNLYTQKRIIKESKKHYTIYKNIKNIIDNTENISIFSNESIQKKGHIENIFLGQPSHEFVEISYSKVLDFLKSKGINKYFPHPREDEKIDGFLYVETKYIFEEYIADLLKNGVEVNVYTINSTAALNIIFLENVKVYVILNEELEENMIDFYKIYREFGVEFYYVN